MIWACLLLECSESHPSLPSGFFPIFICAFTTYLGRGFMPLSATLLSLLLFFPFLCALSLGPQSLCSLHPMQQLKHPTCDAVPPKTRLPVLLHPFSLPLMVLTGFMLSITHGHKPFKLYAICSFSSHQSGKLSATLFHSSCQYLKGLLESWRQHSAHTLDSLALTSHLSPLPSRCLEFTYGLSLPYP